MQVGHGFDGLSNALGDFERFIEVAPFQQAIELFTARPCKDMRLLKFTFQQADKMIERCIAAGMAVSIVDKFEMVDVQHKDGQAG